MSRLRSSALLFVCAASACAASLARTAAAQDAPEVRVGTQLPAWVEPLEVPAPDAAAEGGVEPLARDIQWQIEAGRATRFARSAYRVLTTSGVQDASQLSFPVDADETLVIHYVRRVRDGQITELLRPDMVRVIQPESRLASGLYDGSRRALLFLEDTRVGDVIEHAHSRISTEEHLSGRFARAELVGEARSRLTRFIARWPLQRRIATRVHDAAAHWTAHRHC